MTARGGGGRRGGTGGGVTDKGLGVREGRGVQGRERDGGGWGVRG